MSLNQHDSTGWLRWDRKDQCVIHIAHVAKHFSDYLRYAEKDVFVNANWQRVLQIVTWSLAKYDRNEDKPAGKPQTGPV